MGWHEQVGAALDWDTIQIFRFPKTWGPFFGVTKRRILMHGGLLFPCWDNMILAKKGDSAYSLLCFTRYTLQTKLLIPYCAVKFRFSGPTI